MLNPVEFVVIAKCTGIEQFVCKSCLEEITGIKEKLWNYAKRFYSIKPYKKGFCCNSWLHG